MRDLEGGGIGIQQLINRGGAGFNEVFEDADSSTSLVTMFVCKRDDGIRERNRVFRETGRGKIKLGSKGDVGWGHCRGAGWMRVTTRRSRRRRRGSGTR